MLESNGKTFRKRVRKHRLLSHRVLESMDAGKRLPEAQFTNLKVAAKGQQTVYGIFRKADSTGSSKDAEVEN